MASDRGGCEQAHTLIFLSLHFLHPVRTLRCVLRAPYGLGPVDEFELADAAPDEAALDEAAPEAALRLRMVARRSRVLGLSSPGPEPGTGRYMALTAERASCLREAEQRLARVDSKTWGRASSRLWEGESALSLSLSLSLGPLSLSFWPCAMLPRYTDSFRLWRGACRLTEGRAGLRSLASRRRG